MGLKGPTNYSCQMYFTCISHPERPTQKWLHWNEVCVCCYSPKAPNHSDTTSSPWQAIVGSWGATVQQCLQKCLFLSSYMRCKNWVLALTMVKELSLGEMPHLWKHWLLILCLWRLTRNNLNSESFRDPFWLQVIHYLERKDRLFP